MPGDHAGVSLEGLEGRDERGVALVCGRVEAVVRRPLLRCLPHALDAVQLWRVGRQTEQLDAMMMLSEPAFAVFAGVVARAIVDDEEDLSPRAATNKLFEKVKERAAVEDLG